MIKNRLHQQGDIDLSELGLILEDGGDEAAPGPINIYIIDKLYHANNISNSTVIQGNNAHAIEIDNGETTDSGHHGDDWAKELLRIYNRLDVRKRTELLAYAYTLGGEDDSK